MTNTKGMHQNWDKNQPEHVLKLFLNFEKISASCSYKLGSYKKKSVINSTSDDGSHSVPLLGYLRV